jgi:hypothetical protein
VPVEENAERPDLKRREVTRSDDLGEPVFGVARFVEQRGETSTHAGERAAAESAVGEERAAGPFGEFIGDLIDPRTTHTARISGDELALRDLNLQVQVSDRIGQSTKLRFVARTKFIEG